ncbi:hypothetical protein IV417_03690 [Alphaproteobacteria bacterium KMM 3653]|uniref:Uncharacterized protein n=1 Tax=Harenicola maris TaxID=2841044 RepID=A0AAP2CNQ7_9RHOB|nr:hypothetical protein [Harenicola maris]
MMRAGFIVIAAGLCIGLLGAAYGGAAALAFGLSVLAVLGGLIALTFLWLFSQRATPLALGMALAWLGSGAVAVMLITGGPLWLMGGALICQIGGAVLHLFSIEGAFDLRRGRLVGGALAAALGAGAIIVFNLA